MRRRAHRHLALVAVGVLTLAACGDTTPEEQDVTEQQDGDAATDDLDDPQAQPELQDPNEDVVDGVYRGQGVVLPVPDGWALDEGAFAQGVVAAISEDGAQQLTAQALDVDGLTGPEGEEFDLDELLDNVRGLGDADVDEEVDIEGAERAHQLTFVELPAAQEDLPSTSATIVLAEDGAGLVGEFAYGTTGQEPDEAIEELFLSTIGFDPDSEPAPMTVPPPMPEDLMDELPDELQDDGIQDGELGEGQDGEQPDGG